MLSTAMMFRVCDIAFQTIDNYEINVMVYIYIYFFYWRNLKQKFTDFMIIMITFAKFLHGSDLCMNNY